MAAKVASELGWSLLDNAVVDAVSARLGIPRAEVEAREERVPSLVERLVTAMAAGSNEWMSPGGSDQRLPTDEQLVKVTTQIMEEAIARGPVVVVGRGAQASLAERTDALHVFCYAPRPALIARSMKRDGISEAEAAVLVDETNEQREQWVRKHWNRAWREHEHYHLAVNTEWLGVNGAAALVLHAARERFGLSI